MLRSWIKRLSIVAGFACLAGCGSASPPLGIPAPVSSLMAIAPPDAGGTVSLIGEPGAVLPGAVVSGANITQGGQALRWEILFFGTAWAQVQPSIQRTVVAATDGSFRMRLFGKPGDTIRVVQIVDGETSPSIDLVVPAPPNPPVTDPATDGIP